MLVPLGIVVALASQREWRDRLREPGPYVAVAVASAVFSPVLAWNAGHDWISFAFQIQHGLGRATGSILRREVDLLGGQMGLVSPILFVMMAVAVGHSIRTALRAQSAPLSSLLSFLSLFVVVFFMYSATRRRVEANWPALAYVPAVLVLVGHARSRRWDRWLNAGLVLAATLTTVTYVNTFVAILPVPATRDPAARASGWGDLAAAVHRASTSAEIASADTGRVVRSSLSAVLWIAANRYQEASELAYHLPGNPETFSLNVGSRPNQYDLWPSFAQRATRGDALLLVVDDVAGTHPAVKGLAPHFRDVRQGALVPLGRDGDLLKNVRIWQLTDWRGTWPERPLRSRP